VLNLVGLGGGPIFIGVLSDHFKPSFGSHSLAVAYLALIPVMGLTILSHLLAARAIGRAARPLRRDAL
jgi:hypothetical protein